MIGQISVPPANGETKPEAGEQVTEVLADELMTIESVTVEAFATPPLDSMPSATAAMPVAAKNLRILIPLWFAQRFSSAVPAPAERLLPGWVSFNFPLEQ
ncbi:MAG: hypothetical protein ACREE5_03460 [Acetobacteraceae bacterium]